MAGDGARRLPHAGAMEMTTDNVQRRGMLLMLASVALFSLMDAGLKLLSAH